MQIGTRENTTPGGLQVSGCSIQSWHKGNSVNLTTKKTNYFLKLVDILYSLILHPTKYTTYI